MTFSRHKELHSPLTHPVHEDSLVMPPQSSSVCSSPSVWPGKVGKCSTEMELQSSLVFCFVLFFFKEHAIYCFFLPLGISFDSMGKSNLFLSQGGNLHEPPCLFSGKRRSHDPSTANHLLLPVDAAKLRRDWVGAD